MPVNIKNKLFETRDYSIFKRARGNRPVDKAHVAQLKKLIADKDIGDPVKVNRGLEVIDGQHTLQARRELGLPVPYIIIKYDFTYISILKAMTFEQIFYVIIFAAFGISISQVLWIIGVSKLGIAMASIHMNSAPFYVMVFVFILGGSWVWIQFFALILVVLGVFLTQFERL